MEMKRVKSAIELAMEKVAAMPELKKEDVEQYKNQEQFAIGEGIAQRFLQGALRKKNLEGEFSQYQGEIGEIVRQAALATFCESIDVEDMEKNRLIFDAIQMVWKEVPVKKAQSELIKLHGKYKQQREKELAAAIKTEAGRFHDIGITGSAILPNLKESPAWQERQEKLQQDFHSKLSRVRDMLQP